MGAMWFDKGEFADHLHELIGYKAGIAVSIEDMCELLSDTLYPDDIIQSEKHGIRIRSENYEELYYNILHKVGLTDRRYNGILEIFSLFRDEFMKPGGQQFVTDIWDIFEHYMMIKDEFNGNYLTEMILKAKEKYGIHGMKSMY